MTSPDSSSPSPTPPAAPKRPNYVLDTNTILYAIATGPRESSNCNSEIDKQARKIVPDPDIIRSRICTALSSGNVLIPSVVLKELASKLNSNLLSEENQRKLRKLLPLLHRFEQPILLPRIAYTKQLTLLNMCRNRAETHVKSLRETGTPVPEDWTRISPFITSNSTITDQKLSKLIYNSSQPACVLWHKLHSYMPLVQDAIHRLPMDHPDTYERLYHAKLTALEPKLSDPLLTPTEMEALSNEYAELDDKKLGARLQAIPDFEILMTTQLAQAHGPTALITHDGDFEKISQVMASLQIKVADFSIVRTSVSFDDFMHQINVTGIKQKPLVPPTHHAPHIDPQRPGPLL